MTMTLEKSQAWLEQSIVEQIGYLRAELNNDLNPVREDALDAMASLYRQGWNDCFKLARVHGVKAFAWNEGE